MIIQCEKCQARFRLDDSRVTEKGVKVRCAKCKQVFTVRKEEPDMELTVPALTDVTFAPEGHIALPDPEVQQIVTQPVPDSACASENSEDTVIGNEPVDFSASKTESFDDTAISFDADELNIDGMESSSDSTVASVDKGGEVDFSNFDFGDSDSESVSSSPLSVDDFTDKLPEPVSASLQKESLQGLDFSDDDMFGPVVNVAAPEPSSESISFDFGGDSFAESMDMSSHDSKKKSSALFSLETPSDAPFNLGEIDFGDELTSVAVQQVNPDDLKPSQENLFAPLAEAQSHSSEDDLTRSFLEEVSADDKHELPPLSIASRRQQSPVFVTLIGVIAVLIVSGLGYFGYSSFSSPKDTVSVVSGKIGIRGVKAAFIENFEAGELLVISGEAYNDYPQPRAALQVKVNVLDAAGQTIATQSAYGGNPLTEEQLKNLPLDKIEAAMGNQFGDSLANIEVAPGKAIPFVAVLARIPKSAKDFGVQAAGSTVATGKQQ